MVKISVYIACYNYAKYVSKSIESVIRQTTTQWELIVINDGSTDGTKSVLKRYQENPKIRIIHQENKGLNITNNIALRLATGKYIMRLDADDYLDENALLVLSNILDSKENVDLVYPDYYQVDEEGEVIDLVRREKIDEEVNLLDLPAHGACTMFRTHILKQIGGYIEDFSCQDGYEIWLRFIQKHKPYNVNIPLFYYRQHNGSLTKNQDKILDTRRRIKQQFVKKYKNGNHFKVMGLVTAFRKSIYPKNDPFIDLAGKPLIWYTLSEAEKSKSLDKIILSSEDEEVLDYAKQFESVIPLKRDSKLTKIETKMEDICIDVLYTLREQYKYEPDAICTLYINTPLRRAHHIDWAINTMQVFKVETVISVQEELSYCYNHSKNGLIPIKNSSTHLRIERDGVYKENGAVYLFRLAALQGKGVRTKTVGHIIMLPEESVKINSVYEHWLTECILKNWKLYKNNFKKNGPHIKKDRAI